MPSTRPPLARLTRPHPHLGWALFCAAHVLLASSSAALGQASPVGVLAGQAARALRRVPRARVLEPARR